MAGVTITLNMAAVKERLQEAAQRAVADTAKAALEDCNNYCKQDQGQLINSSYIHSEPEKGILRWKTPYARIQYYVIDGVRNKRKRPQARKMWAHHAASVHGAEWLLRMQTAFTKYAKER